MFCSCGQPQIPDTSIESVTSDATAADVTTETIIETTDIAETTASEIKLEDRIAYYKSGYLYDFDLDGIPEIFRIFGDLWGELCIYKIVNEEIMEIECYIPINSVRTEWFTIPDITLYYDKLNNEYFYVIEHDIWEKYWNIAEVNKYVFKDNEIITTNIAQCDFMYNENTVEISSNKLLGEDTTPIGVVERNKTTHYYDGVEEYLSQFEKIKEIPYEELTAVSIEDAINSGTLADYLP